MRFLAIGGVIDRIAGVSQRGLQLARQIDVVLDEQYAHSALSHDSPATGVDHDVRNPTTGILPTHHNHSPTVAGTEETAGTTGRSTLHRFADADTGTVFHLLTRGALTITIAVAAILRRGTEGRGGDQGGQKEGGCPVHGRRSRLQALNDG